MVPLVACIGVTEIPPKRLAEDARAVEQGPNGDEAIGWRFELSQITRQADEIVGLREVCVLGKLCAHVDVC